MRSVASCLLAAVVLFGCGGSKSASSASTIGAGIDLETMTTAQARQVVDEYRSKYGYPVPPAPASPPSSMVEVLQIVKGDRISEYDAAREFAAGKQGAEALTVRAYLELSLGSAMMTVAAILKYTEQQKANELRQIQTRQQAGAALSAGETQQLNELSAEVGDLRQVARALNILSEEPLKAGEGLATEAIRQYPDNRAGHLAAANYFRLRHNWLEFDREMRRAERGETNPPPLHSFLRAMEALERYVNAAGCRAQLNATLEKDPSFVRAQANLIVAEEDIELRYAALQKLRALNPQHPVVTIAGKNIEEEYEVTVELRKALGNE